MSVMTSPQTPQRARVKAKPSSQPPPALPRIPLTGRHLRDKTEDAMRALMAANRPPRLFVRGGQLVRIGRDEHSTVLIEPLAEAALRGLLARAANFVSGTKAKPVDPPLTVVRDILAIGEWPFPALVGCTECPIIAPDGQVITQTGYDATTRLYYAPRPGLAMPAVPETPSQAQRHQALALLQELLCDFPFADEASHANALGLLLTAVLRPLIDGLVPMAVLDKPQAGTGATLLAQVVGVLATGADVPMTAVPDSDAEWRKTITALLRKGRNLVVLDNLNERLDAPALAEVLTTDPWEDRLLGKSEMVHVPHRTIWITSGNNVLLGGDLPRRCYWVRLDAQQARPWLRQGFKHPCLQEWVQAQRGQLLVAVFTLARAWVVAGRPPAAKAITLGSFESWVHTIGGILAYAGVKEFLGNLDEMYETADDDAPQWEAFLIAWYAHCGSQWVRTRDIAAALQPASVTPGTFNPNLLSALPDSLADAGKNLVQRLGMALNARKDVRYPSGLHIEKGKDPHTKICLWRVMP